MRHFLFMFFFSRRKVSAIYIITCGLHMQPPAWCVRDVAGRAGPIVMYPDTDLRIFLEPAATLFLSGGIRAAAKRVLGESTGDSERKIRTKGCEECVPLVLTDSRTKDGVLDPLG